MHVNKVINELKVKSYSYNEVREILESITKLRTVSAYVPKEIKKGDVFIASNGGKRRPHCVIKVLEDIVLAIPLSTTEDEINLIPFESRFLKNGFFSKSITPHKKRDVLDEFIGVLENPKAVNKAIKEVKEFILKNL